MKWGPRAPLGEKTNERGAVCICRPLRSDLPTSCEDCSVIPRLRDAVCDPCLSPSALHTPLASDCSGTGMGPNQSPRHSEPWFGHRDRGPHSLQLDQDLRGRRAGTAPAWCLRRKPTQKRAKQEMEGDSAQRPPSSPGAHLAAVLQCRPSCPSPFGLGSVT